MCWKDREIIPRLLRVIACILMLAAGAAARSGRLFGCDLRPATLSQFPISCHFHIDCWLFPHFHISTFSPVSASRVAALAVIVAAAFLPLITRSRRWRTALLLLDIAVLGFWNGLFLSTARMVGWAGAGLPAAPVDLAAALLMLAMAFLYPVFGRASHYCLNACPFGAAQELAGRLPARKWRLSPTLIRRLESFRRLLWAALMFALWCGSYGRWMEWELFGSFAWRAVPPLLTALAVLFVALSVFVPRAYCRFVCPTGALFKISESNQ